MNLTGGMLDGTDRPFPLSTTRSPTCIVGYRGLNDVRAIEARLCGLAYERDVVAGALSAVNPTDYFGDVSREDILNTLCP